mgnify:CR=1 FL=1
MVDACHSGVLAWVIAQFSPSLIMVGDQSQELLRASRCHQEWGILPRRPRASGETRLGPSWSAGQLSLRLRDHWSNLIVTSPRGRVSSSWHYYHHHCYITDHHCHCHHQIISGLENFPPLLPAHSDLGLLQLTHHFKSLGFYSLFLTTAYLISLETLEHC